MTETLIAKIAASTELYARAHQHIMERQQQNLVRDSRIISKRTGTRRCATTRKRADWESAKNNSKFIFWRTVTIEVNIRCPKENFYGTRDWEER